MEIHHKRPENIAPPLLPPPTDGDSPVTAQHKECNLVPDIASLGENALFLLALPEKVVTSYEVLPELEQADTSEESLMVIDFSVSQEVTLPKDTKKKTQPSPMELKLHSALQQQFLANAGAGVNLSEIARSLNISRQRVHQLYRLLAAQMEVPPVLPKQKKQELSSNTKNSDNQGSTEGKRSKKQRVLELRQAGFGSTQIAKELGIKVTTVTYHLKNLADQGENVYIGRWGATHQKKQKEPKANSAREATAWTPSARDIQILEMRMKDIRGEESFTFETMSQILGVSHETIKRSLKRWEATGVKIRTNSSKGHHDVKLEQFDKDVHEAWEASPMGSKNLSEVLTTLRGKKVSKSAVDRSFRRWRARGVELRVTKDRPAEQSVGHNQPITVFEESSDALRPTGD